MKHYFYISCLFIICSKGISQEKKNDSIKAKTLQEVVITGQFVPQSIKKSVFNVKVFTSADIQNLAANNLSDLLNQYLNTTIRPSGTSGRSTVAMFGLDAQYFKILVDGVPLVNEAGFGNNTDVSQINLNDIAQIEIVEGSMGVTHGANAVSGVLNIVTKKASPNKWNISTTIQEETVKNEFEFFDKGRHIQALKASHTITENWFVSLGANRNDFQGFLNNKKGKNYQENDSMRGYQWLPKEQTNTTGLIAYRKNNFKAFYKLEYLQETVDFYNSTVQSGYNSQLGSYRYASDKRYITNRYFHNVNATGKIFSKYFFNVSFSQQKQVRNVEDFRYYLQTQSEGNVTVVKDQAMKVFYSTGTISNFFEDKKVDLQLGYEIVNNKGFALVQEANNFLAPVEKTLENYDIFISSEIKATEKLSIRSGLRVSVPSKFKDQFASSMALKYWFANGIEIRGSYGNSFRTPTFEELYSKQIFDGHFFSGNENLIPETSSSYELSYKKTSQLFTKVTASNTVSASFLDVKDRIDMALVRFNADTGNPEYQYVNISKYRMWNFSTTNQFKKENWTVNVGASLIGISQKIENQIFASNEKYLYTFNLNGSVSYTIPKWKTTFSTYYKYNGKAQQFIEGTSEYIISTIDSSNWLDASIRKTFLHDTLETTIGARNLLNVINSNQTNVNQGAGHASPSQIMLAYGRSYFFKITYNLNF